MNKFIKNWGIPFLIAVFIAIPLNTFVVSMVQVKADVLTGYVMNDRTLINKTSKNVKVGDIIIFKKDKNDYIRKVASVNGNTIIVSDKNGKKINIDKTEVIGKAMCKVF